MKKYVLLLATTLVLVGCSQKASDNKVSNETTVTTVSETTISTTETKTNAKLKDEKLEEIKEELFKNTDIIYQFAIDVKENKLDTSVKNLTNFNARINDDMKNLKTDVISKKAFPDKDIQPILKLYNALSEFYKVAITGNKEKINQALKNVDNYVKNASKLFDNQLPEKYQEYHNK